MAELAGFRLSSPDTVYGADITPSLFSEDEPAPVAPAATVGAVHTRAGWAPTRNGTVLPHYYPTRQQALAHP